MPFKMSCPKCGGADFVIQRDNLRYPGVDESFALVYSCRCGKQLFGSSVVEEYDRQKRQYESDAEARVREERDRVAREVEEAEREAKLQEAMAFRSEYLRRKREEQETEERNRRAERDRRWRERVANGEEGEEYDEDRPPPERPPEPSGQPKASAPPPPARSEPEELDYDSIVEDPNKDPALCAWPPCQNERRPNSKYCSRACSNKNARFRYRQRRKTD